MKYKYIPRDIAVFFIKADFIISDERRIIDDLWSARDKMIWYKYRVDKELFIREIYYEISKCHDSVDFDEINIILKDIGSNYYIDGEIDECSIIHSYFKVIKLNLTYVSGCNYKKIKLRNLIGCFGYKRRIANQIDCINKTLSALSLRVYLRGGVPCDIGSVKLDDVIIIKLKN